MNKKETLFCKNRKQWRKWLEKNHDTKTDIWLIYYKKHVKKQSILYEEAVEEATCFGWIDSKVNRIDDERFMQKYTPRNPKSVWSKLNKERAQRMIKQGSMTSAGCESIEQAKKSGRWQKAYTSRKKLALPEEIRKALQKNKRAWENFTSFANTYQNMYIGWILEAKREEIRKRRIKEVVKRSALNKKAGIE